MKEVHKRCMDAIKAEDVQLLDDALSHADDVNVWLPAVRVCEVLFGELQRQVHIPLLRCIVGPWTAKSLSHSVGRAGACSDVILPTAGAARHPSGVATVSGLHR